jgi:hypothetical protein
MPAEGAYGEVVSSQAGCTDCGSSASESSFDRLARGLADGTISRRKALTMLGAALAGGLLASIPGMASAQPQKAAGRAACRPQCPEGYTCTRLPRDAPLGGQPLNPFLCCPGGDPLGDCCLPEDICSNGECCGDAQCTPNGQCCEGQIMPNGECCEGRVTLNGECCPSPMIYCRQTTCDASGNCVSCEVCCPAGVRCVFPGTETDCPITCAS